ncbi:MAG: DUF1579 domain-containing protein [Acidobacteriota bacterium]
MRFRNFLGGLAIAMLVAGAAWAQEKPAAKKAKPAPMDEKAAMEAMQKAATPGDAHKKLEGMVGTFDAKVKMWMDPSKPPEESTGTSENAWVLGNRFVETKYQGTFMGQPFSGIGYTGYDNVTKKYVGTWMDTASTGVMTSKGTMEGNVMKSTATMSDPMTGKTMTSTMKTTVADNDHHTMEMWGPGPNGKNYKMMEIEYTRKK